jgi:hypothetical protein
MQPCTSWDETTKTGTFNWDKVDALVRKIFEIGAQPIITLGGAKSTGMTELPKGMTVSSTTGLPSTTSWAAYTTAWVKHFKTLGLPVKYYEIVNEPQRYFAANGWSNIDYTKLANYKAVFDAAYTSMHKENSAVLISQDFITYKTVLEYWLSNGGVVDTLNFHKYDEYRYPYLTDEQVFAYAESKFFGPYPLGGYSITDSQARYQAVRGKLLPIINSESNMNSKYVDGTDPRIQQLAGTVWLALTLRMDVLKGVSYNVYYAWSSSKSIGEKTTTGGYGFGMINKDDGKPWYPYYLSSLVGNSLGVGDVVVASSSSSSDVRTLSWIHGDQLNLLVVSTTSESRTLSISGLEGTMSISRIDNGVSWKTPKVQTSTANAGSLITTNGYTILLIQTQLTTNVPSSPTSTSSITVDDSSAGFVGSWPLSSSTSGYYGSGYRYRWAGSGSNTATWGFTTSQAGSWEVFARWTSGSNRATNAPYTVTHAKGSTTVSVNQQVSGGSWQSLGVYSFGSGSYKVSLSDNANDVVIADAIRLEFVSSSVSDVVVDDSSAGFVGSWPLSSSTSGYYGSGYRYRWAGSGSNTATWSFSIPLTGSWRVYAMWTSGSNRASDAPYTVYHAGGATIVDVNQQVNGGSWVAIGTYSFNAGSGSVRLTDNANGVVIADAIKLEYLG